MLMTHLADLDTNSNPSAVRTDDDGNVMSRTILRRDSMQWNTSMHYELKVRSWMQILMRKGIDTLQVTLQFRSGINPMCSEKHDAFEHGSCACRDCTKEAQPPTFLRYSSSRSGGVTRQVRFDDGCSTCEC